MAEITAKMVKELREMTVERVAASRIKNQALKEGMVTLRMNALDKVKKGESTVEELIRVTQDW